MDTYSRALSSTALALAVCSLLLTACETTSIAPLPTRMDAIGIGGNAATPVVEKVASGVTCEADADCESDHCSNHVCCSKGDCCKVVADCGFDPKNSLVCDDPATCQGTRGTVMCSSSHRCVVMEGGEDDDSGCTAMMEADDCGLYKSSFCSGTKTQTAPKCIDTCASNDDCDMGAHCADSKCITNLPDGGACKADTDCASAHCNTGLCCKEGDCCMLDTDCDPTKYGTPPTCTDTAMCQGSRGVAACMENKCGTRMADDDSACDRNVVANACGDSPVKCRGGADQPPPPPCATGTCGGFFGGSTCNEGAFCWQGKCVPDQPDGESCVDDKSCQGGHCANNVCCAGGDCCTSDDQCPAVRTCDQPGMCQGKRQERHCDVPHGVCEKTGMPVDDDSACVGKPPTVDCGMNFVIPCSAAPDQTPPMAPAACVPCTTTYVCEPSQGTFHIECPGMCATMVSPARPPTGGSGGDPGAWGMCLDKTTPKKPQPVGCSLGATSCQVGVCK